LSLFVLFRYGLALQFPVLLYLVTLFGDRAAFFGNGVSIKGKQPNHSNDEDWA
jgi:hypothetical protein